jgi:hypothetical protein
MRHISQAFSRLASFHSHQISRLIPISHRRPGYLAPLGALIVAAVAVLAMYPDFARNIVQVCPLPASIQNRHHLYYYDYHHHLHLIYCHLQKFGFGAK